jgi:hypothetical protein
MAVFWDVAPSSLKLWSVSARPHGATSQKRTIRGDKLLWNVGQCLLDNTVLHPRIQPSSYLQILSNSQGFIQIPTLPTSSQSCACMDTCTNTHTIYQYMCYVFSAEMFPNSYFRHFTYTDTSGFRWGGRCCCTYLQNYKAPKPKRTSTLFYLLFSSCNLWCYCLKQAMQLFNIKNTLFSLSLKAL